jgi:hypothetical protein
MANNPGSAKKNVKSASSLALHTYAAEDASVASSRAVIHHGTHRFGRKRMGSSAAATQARSRAPHILDTSSRPRAGKLTENFLG